MKGDRLCLRVCGHIMRSGDVRMTPVRGGLETWNLSKSEIFGACCGVKLRTCWWTTVVKEATRLLRPWPYGHGWWGCYEAVVRY